MQLVHPSLYGILLSRAVDLRSTFSLGLAVEFVRITTTMMTFDEQIFRSCMSAAHPIFIGLLQNLLQHGLGTLLSNGTNAEIVLGCLTSAFPRERVADDVLAVVAQECDRIPDRGITAALVLMKARQVHHIAVTSQIKQHCINTVIPRADPSMLAHVADLLVKCGCGSADVFAAVESRCEHVLTQFQAAEVAALCRAYQEARHENVELFTAILANVVPPLADRMTGSQLFTVISTMFLFHVTHGVLVRTLVISMASRLEDLSIHDIKKLCKIAASIKATKGDLPASLCNAVDARFTELSDVESGTADPISALAIAQSLVRLKQWEHPVVLRLLQFVFEHRSMVVQRHAMLELVQEIFREAPENLHEGLYRLAKGDIVLGDGKLISYERTNVAEGDGGDGEAKEEESQRGSGDTSVTDRHRSRSTWRSSQPSRSTTRGALDDDRDRTVGDDDRDQGDVADVEPSAPQEPLFQAIKSKAGRR